MSSTDPQPPTAYELPTSPNRPAWYTRRWVHLVAVAIIAFALGAVTGSGSQSGTATASPQPTTTATTTTTVTSTVQQTAAADTATAASTVPTPADLKPSIRIKSKECFGSAGCNVAYTIDLTWVGASPKPAADVSYEVTYQVTGGQDGAQIGTITATGEKYDNVDGMLRTSSSSSKLSVKITRVDTA